MASSDLLSQDEINALLHGVDSGEVDSESVSDGVARPFDFTSQNRIDQGRMPMLDKINEHFASYFRVSLFNMLRCTAEISVADVQTMKFSEYLHSLLVPASLNLVRINPLRGKALCVIDPRLVFIAVDNYFGGCGRLAKIEGREFSPTEVRLIQIMLLQAFKDLEAAWKAILPVTFELLGREDNPQFANIVSHDEVVVICSFHIELKGAAGTFYIVMPQTMLMPIRGLLSAGIPHDSSESADHWAAVLREELKAAEVTLSCNLPDSKLTLGELLKLKQGDIIPINHPDEMTVVAEHVPLFRGTYGVRQGKKAIKIQEIVKRPESNDEKYTRATVGIKA